MVPLDEYSFSAVPLPKGARMSREGSSAMGPSSWGISCQKA